MEMEMEMEIEIEKVFEEFESYNFDNEDFKVSI